MALGESWSSKNVCSYPAIWEKSLTSPNKWPESSYATKILLRMVGFYHPQKTLGFQTPQSQGKVQGMSVKYSSLRTHQGCTSSRLLDILDAQDIRKKTQNRFFLLFYWGFLDITWYNLTTLQYYSIEVSPVNQSMPWPAGRWSSQLRNSGDLLLKGDQIDFQIREVKWRGGDSDCLFIPCAYSTRTRTSPAYVWKKGTADGPSTHWNGDKFHEFSSCGCCFKMLETEAHWNRATAR